MTARVIRVADVAAERVRWLWPGRLPLGKVSVLDGDPKLGKSTLTLDIAAHVTTGAPFPDGHRPQIGSVVLLSAEDGIGDTIRPRLEAAGADLSRVVVFESVAVVDDHGVEIGERPPRLPQDVLALEAVVEQEHAVLVVVDVLNAFLDRGVDSYRDQDVRSALLPLARMVERQGCALLALRHLSKSGGSNPLYRGGGSIGIIGAARSALLVAPDPDDESRRVFAVTACNLAAPAESLLFRLIQDEERECSVIQWEGVSSHGAAALLDDPQARSALDDAVEFLTALLAHGPMSAEDVKREATRSGISYRTLRRAKAAARVDVGRVGFGRGSHMEWRLRGDHDPIAVIDGQVGALDTNGTYAPVLDAYGDHVEEKPGHCEECGTITTRPPTYWGSVLCSECAATIAALLDEVDGWPPGALTA